MERASRLALIVAALSLTSLVAVIAAAAWLGSTRVPEAGGLPTLRGRVVDSTGRPIAGALVKLSSDDVGGLDDLATDPEGAFVRELPPGRWFLTVSARGHAANEAFGRDASRGLLFVSDLELPPLVLAPETALEGVLRDDAGTPVAGRVWFNRFEDRVDNFPFHCDCGTDGRFHFTGLYETVYPVHAFASGHEHLTFEVPIVRETTTHRDLVIPRREEGDLTVLVHDANGAPVPHATVDYRHKDGLPNQWTDANGKCGFDEISVGPIEAFVVDEAKGVAAFARGEIRRGQRTTLELGLTECCRLNGRVVDARGRPVACRVWANEMNGIAWSLRGGGTDANGRFELLAPEGVYAIIANICEDALLPLTRVEGIAVTRSATAICEITVRTPPGSVRGRIHEHEEMACFRAPLIVPASPGDETASAEDKWRGHGGVYATVHGMDSCSSRDDVLRLVLEADGSFEIPALPPGSYWLILPSGEGSVCRRGSEAVIGTPHSGIVGFRRFDVRSDEALDLGTIEARTGGRVRVHLTRKDGRALSNIGIYLGREDAPFAARLVTNKEGRAESGFLPDGSYTIELGKEGALMAGAKLGVARARVEPARVVIDQRRDAEVELVVAGE